MNIGIGEILKKIGMGGGGKSDSPSADFARSWLEAAQSGALSEGSGMIDMARMYSNMTAPQSPMTQVMGEIDQAAQTAPAPMAIQPPQPVAFNITNPTGTKPKNYTPYGLTFDAPQPSMLAALGLPNTGGFAITNPSGTKPKNYRPYQLAMTMPQMAGPDRLQQILMAMNSGQLSPFGTRQG